MRTVRGAMRCAASARTAAHIAPSHWVAAASSPAAWWCAALPVASARGSNSRHARWMSGHAHAHASSRHAPLSIDEARVHYSYHVLRVNVGADVATIKHSFRQLAKELHPDSNASAGNGAESSSGSSTRGDAKDFQRVQEAYTYLTGLHSDVLRHVGERHQQRSREGGALDLSGNAPDADVSSGSSSSSSSYQPVPNAAHANIVQNRAYLRNEGVGFGHSPTERDKQYRSHRLSRGVGGAMDYRAEQWSREADRVAAETSQSSSSSSQHKKELAAFDSLLSVTRAAGTGHISSTIMVEEAIKDAMSRWDSREIKDFGRPLSHLEGAAGGTPAGIDPLEAKLNAILLRNGVLPDFMQLERQVDADYKATVAELEFVWNQFVTEEHWKEGNKIKADAAAHAAATAAAATTPSGPFASTDKAAASAAPSASPVDDAASQPPSPSPSPLPALSAEAVSLRLSYAEPYGPAWALAVREFHSSLRTVNAQVDSYNIAVPSLSRQRCHFPAAGLVEGVEARPPSRALLDSAQLRVRERLAAFRATKRGGGGGGRHAASAKKKRSSGSLTASNHLAASINGEHEPLDLGVGRAVTAADLASLDAAVSSSSFIPDVSSSVSELDTSDLNDVEMEELYRSLSGSERQELQDAEARRQRIRSHTTLPPAIVAALVGGSVAVLAVPVWLVRKSRANNNNQLHDEE